MTSSLELQTVRRIDRTADDFEQQWKLDRRPTLVEFLAEWNEPERSELLRELLFVDLFHAARCGATWGREAYLAVLPGDARLIDSVLAEAIQNKAIASDTSEPWSTSIHGDRAEDLNSSSGRAADGCTGPDRPRSDRYKIIKEIGNGSFGIVFLATDTKLKRQIALKCPLSDRQRAGMATKRFRREAQLSARLNHAGIVAIHDIAEDERGQPIIVMEYVEGRSLRERLADGPIPADESARVARKISEALQHAHEAGLVHRDLKPANILLDEQGQPHIADLGLAIDERDRPAPEGQWAGTFAYMAPEQLRSSGEESHLGAVDARTDIWAVGVILYEMLTGERPFRVRTVHKPLPNLCESILRDDVTPPRKLNDAVPAPLEAICLKCLNKLPADRYASAKDLADALRAFTDDTKRWTAKRGALAAAILAVVLTAVVLTAGGKAWRFVDGLMASLGLRAADGVLAISNRDPHLDLVVDNQGDEIAIAGTGVQQIPLRPGMHTLVGRLNGRIVYSRDVEVPSAGERRHEIRLGEQDQGPFLIEGEAGSFRSLAAAFHSATDGDVIVVRGNGPFECESISIGNLALTFRAAVGCAPAFTLAHTRNGPFIRTRGRLTLEGLELRCGMDANHTLDTSAPWLIDSEGGDLFILNCRFIMHAQRRMCGISSRYARLCTMRNCEFYISQGKAINWYPPSSGELVMENCVFQGESPVMVYLHNGGPSHIRLASNTIVAEGALKVSATMRKRPDESVHCELINNAMDVQHVVFCALKPDRKKEEILPLVQRIVELRQAGNFCAVRKCFLLTGQGGKGAGSKDQRIAYEWDQAWDISRTDFHRSEVLCDSRLNTVDNPFQLSTSDFQLCGGRSASVAGDVPQVGATLHWVGPGEAYERWKQTPAYQEWRLQYDRRGGR